MSPSGRYLTFVMEKIGNLSFFSFIFFIFAPDFLP